MIKLWLAIGFVIVPLIGCTSHDPITTEIQFKGVDIELSGEFNAPSHSGLVPGILLMPGSGPTDRDGNQPGLKTDVLKSLSDELVKNGYATFRFDKRPVRRYLAQWPKMIEEISPYFSFENHLADAEAAVKILKSQPGVDPTRIYLLGHSEGGLIANQIANRVEAHGLVLLGTPGRPMDVILREQLMRNISAIQDVEMRTRLTTDLDRGLKALKIGTDLPEGIHPGLASIFNPSTRHIMHGYFNADPIAAAQSFTGPVFIGNGEMDSQISAIDDAPLLAKSYSNATLKIIPKASHNFKSVTKSTDTGISGPIQQDLITSLLSWLKEQSP